ncbi:uncharacterized protein K489DRAFT_314955 [Dissoconium aciculare CBS 342.82]|uniref:Peptidase S54 rhomboid domain-containing protein n=1 Tax=Dissoconium aciculare CBS 342.82 TaxID=1314786 RepID=A0A6J3MA59_9PEZI|nr:uncharacterized protein K489DRAFT_314955 [Dissoconium aciculare CBS 342.82]KAF1824916.1 hypothetical protein K489DRAFT_314955 [Dissoconium aciculare CBS 342.82]
MSDDALRTWAEGYLASGGGATAMLKLAKRRSNALLAISIIIGINAAVFVTWQFTLSTNNQVLSTIMQSQFMTSNLHMAHNCYFSLVGAAFSHTSPVHFFFNVVNLWSLGSFLVTIPGIGAAHVIGITLSSAIIGNLCQLQRNPPGDRILLGASGVVMGIAAVATCCAPSAPMRLFLIPVNFPLWVFTVGYALVDSYYINSPTATTGHAAHIGGGLAGVAYYWIFLRRYGAQQLARKFLRSQHK